MSKVVLIGGLADGTRVDADERRRMVSIPVPTNQIEMFPSKDSKFTMDKPFRIETYKPTEFMAPHFDQGRTVDIWAQVDLSPFEAIQCLLNRHPPTFRKGDVDKINEICNLLSSLPMEDRDMIFRSFNR